MKLSGSLAGLMDQIDREMASGALQRCTGPCQEDLPLNAFSGDHRKCNACRGDQAAGAHERKQNREFNRLMRW